MKDQASVKDIIIDEVRPMESEFITSKFSDFFYDLPPVDRHQHTKIIWEQIDSSISLLIWWG